MPGFGRQCHRHPRLPTGIPLLGTEFGNKPSGPMQLGPASRSRDFYGGFPSLTANSIFSARSFFQVGSVKPAHENNYGFVAGPGPVRGAISRWMAPDKKLLGQRERQCAGASRLRARAAHHRFLPPTRLILRWIDAT